jgi:pSer/pThr/pTyr-binding forkhead associated (FHA) protein
MSAALSSPRTGFKFTISIRQGPDKGASYQLLPPKVTIGRAPENNIVLSDPKASRAAAQIEFSPEQIVITDLSKRGALAVNGLPTAAESIKDGDRIQIGDTEFIFQVEALIMAPVGLAPSIQPPGSYSATRANTSPRQQQQGGNKLMFYVLILALLGTVAWFMTTKPKISNPGIVLRTTDKMTDDIKASNDRVDEIIKKRTFKNDEEKTRFEEAQKQYLVGFRDYQKGQYMRAMREFETALAIDPENALARRYYKLSEKQRDEIVADLSLEGRRYKDKHMYSRCTSAFEKVLEQIPNKDDAKYKEADSLRKECELLEVERFQ